MIFEGEHSVIEAIKEKQRLIEVGEKHDHLRVLCIQGGGIMRGAYGVGGMLALEEMGYTKTFASLVGVSSGAPVIAYFSSGETQKVIDLLINDCLDKSFVNLWRFWNQVNTQHFIDVVKKHDKNKINLQKVFDNPAEIFFGATHFKTAKPVLLKTKSGDNFFKAMHASINMPNITPVKIMIDGVRYTDGGFANPHIFYEAVQKLKPTHVLIVTNNDREFGAVSIVEKILNRTLYRLRLNGMLALAINTRREARDSALEKVIKSNVKTAIVWGDGSIGAFESDANKIKATVESSRVWWHGLFLKK